jgi:23S rRNA pseudouridine1911/1915/1917 synthase
MSEMKVYSFIVDEEEAGERVDSWLAGQIPELSRSRIQKALGDEEVLIGGLPAEKPSRRLRGGEKVEIRFSPPKPVEVLPEDIPLDIVYEDEGLLVINKPAGMVVHPAPGNETGTMVNALLAHCRDLSGIGGFLRPGIVHRLDARTTGLLVVAKSDEVHIDLSRQLMERSVKRIYRALVWGSMPSEEGVIDAPIGRSRSDRKKMAVIRDGGREAVTYYSVIDTFPPLQYIKLKLGTGRTHQIRVHLAHAGHPVLGDPEYGGRKFKKGNLPKEEAERGAKALSLIDRQALHAGELSFFHPLLKREMSFEAPLPDDFRVVLEMCTGDR